jgi:hypothetical protein
VNRNSQNEEQACQRYTNNRDTSLQGLS